VIEAAVWVARFVTYATWRAWVHALGPLWPFCVYDRVAWWLRLSVYWARDVRGPGQPHRLLADCPCLECGS
jgi:hypothetical protein